MRFIEPSSRWMVIVRQSLRKTHIALAIDAALAHDRAVVIAIIAMIARFADADAANRRVDGYLGDRHSRREDGRRGERRNGNDKISHGASPLCACGA